MSVGMVIMRPTSIVVAGGGTETASIRAAGGVEFANATSLSLNGVFTADYDNYMISMRQTGNSSGSQIDGRLRSAGTDNSTASSYVSQYLSSDNTTVAASRTTSTFAIMGAFSNVQRDGMTIFVYGPNLAQPTAMRVVSVDSISSARSGDSAITHNQSTAYDGFTLLAQGGSNFTGMITVMGYAQ